HPAPRADRVPRTRHRRLDPAPTAYVSRGIGGTAGTCVGDDDDVELAGRGSGEQPAQVAREDGLLVVRRYHDADCRLAHAAQDNRCRDGETASQARLRRIAGGLSAWTASAGSPPCSWWCTAAG